MNTGAPTLAKDIQDCGAAWLAAGAEFSGITILSRRKKDIRSDIEAAIAELGVCIYVYPGLPVSVKNVPGPYADRYELRTRVIEDVLLNTMKPDAFELAELILRRFHLQQFEPLAGMNPLLIPESGRPVVEIEDAGGRRMFDVILETSIGFLPRQEN